MSHRPLREQVIVITGASSGIGLATARAAADEGARLVLAARSEDTLQEVCEQLSRQGGEAVAVSADVSVRADVQRIADTAIARFGRIDTWVNDAAVSIYGHLENVSDEDSRRLFDVNFWGVVHGSLVALPHLRASRGALVNLGSEVSEAVVPLQGMYSASKHAVKGFTDALRVEVEDVERSSVTVTLIQPTAVDTPFPQHARNYMPKEPKLPTPQLDPEDVAHSILKAAEHGGRDIKVGTMARLNVAASKLMGSAADRTAAMQAGRQQYEEPPRDPEGTLWRPGHAGQERGSGGAVRH
jgi:short-subunit dehydrogenase